MIRIVDILKNIEKEKATEEEKKKQKEAGSTEKEVPSAAEKPPVQPSIKAQQETKTEPKPEPKIGRKRAQIIKPKIAAAESEPEAGPSSEIKALCEGIIGQIKRIIAKRELDEEAKASGRELAALTGRLVDEFLPDGKEILKKINQVIISDGVFAEAMKIALHSLELGRDAKFEREQLIVIGLAAMVMGLEQSATGDMPGYKILRGAVKSMADIDRKEYKDIIGLVEIYEAAKPSA